MKFVWNKAEFAWARVSPEGMFCVTVTTILLGPVVTTEIGLLTERRQGNALREMRFQSNYD